MSDKINKQRPLWKKLVAAAVVTVGTGGVGSVTLPLNYNAKSCYTNAKMEYAKHPGTEILVRSWSPYVLKAVTANKTTLLFCSPLTGKIEDSW